MKARMIATQRARLIAADEHLEHVPPSTLTNAMKADDLPMKGRSDKGNRRAAFVPEMAVEAPSAASG